MTQGSSRQLNQAAAADQRGSTALRAIPILLPPRLLSFVVRREKMLTSALALVVLLIGCRQKEVVNTVRKLGVSLNQ